MADFDDSEIEPLLAPISEDAPVGEDPRENYSPSSRYFQLKDARSEARDLERRAAVDEDEGGEARQHWRIIAELAPKALAEDAKDLEIAAWYIEALVRLADFEGLAQGFQIAAALVERFWDDGVYPLPDEDGVETRVAPLGGLSGYDGPGALIQPMNMVTLISVSDPGPLAYWQYEQAVEIAKIGDSEKQAARLASGAISLDAFKSAATRAASGAMRETYRAADAALTQFRRLQDALLAKAGDDAPPGSNITGALEAILLALRTLNPSVISEDVGAELVSEPSAETADASAIPGAVNTGSGVPQPITRREDALKLLLQVADYFEATEPNSILASTLREAVRRARLSLNELVEELIPDQAAREGFLQRAGIQPPASANTDGSW